MFCFKSSPETYISPLFFKNSFTLGGGNAPLPDLPPSGAMLPHIIWLALDFYLATPLFRIIFPSKCKLVSLSQLILNFFRLLSFFNFNLDSHNACLLPCDLLSLKCEGHSYLLSHGINIEYRPNITFIIYNTILIQVESM